MQTESNPRREAAASAQPSEKRRKLIQAALTAPPVVATLHSSTAAAVSAYQCATFDRANPPATNELAIENASVPATDTWMRQTILIDQYVNTADSSLTQWVYINGNDFWVFTDGTSGRGTFGPKQDLSILNAAWTPTGATSRQIDVIQYFYVESGDTGVDLNQGVKFHPAFDSSTESARFQALHGTCLTSFTTA